MNPGMAPIKTNNNRICSIQMKENTELSAAHCVQVWWRHQTYCLSTGRTVGLCVQVRWRHRTDGLSPGRTAGLPAGLVGQFVIKTYSRVFIIFYSLNSFSFNFNPAVRSLIPSEINSYFLHLYPLKLEVVLVTPIHRAANNYCRWWECHRQLLVQLVQCRQESIRSVCLAVDVYGLQCTKKTNEKALSLSRHL